MAKLLNRGFLIKLRRQFLEMGAQSVIYNSLFLRNFNRNVFSVVIKFWTLFYHQGLNSIVVWNTQKTVFAISIWWLRSTRIFVKEWQSWHYQGVDQLPLNQLLNVLSHCNAVFKPCSVQKFCITWNAFYFQMRKTKKFTDRNLRQNTTWPSSKLQLYCLLDRKTNWQTLKIAPCYCLNSNPWFTINW